MIEVTFGREGSREPPRNVKREECSVRDPSFRPSSIQSFPRAVLVPGDLSAGYGYRRSAHSARFNVQDDVVRAE